MSPSVSSSPCSLSLSLSCCVSLCSLNLCPRILSKPCKFSVSVEKNIKRQGNKPCRLRTTIFQNASRRVLPCAVFGLACAEQPAQSNLHRATTQGCLALDKDMNNCHYLLLSTVALGMTRAHSPKRIGRGHLLTKHPRPLGTQ